MDMESIIHCSDREAHAVLIALCKADYTVQSRAEALLLRLSANGNSANGNKRKATDDGLSTCIHCEEDFDDDENTETACWYHEGQLEPDYEADIWADVYNEDVDANNIDTDENREEYPEGFFWNCCGKHGDEVEKCMNGRHVADESNKRARHEANAYWNPNVGYGAGQEEEDDEEEDDEEEDDEDDAHEAEHGAYGQVEDDDDGEDEEQSGEEDAVPQVNGESAGEEEEDEEEDEVEEDEGSEGQGVEEEEDEHDEDDV